VIPFCIFECFEDIPAWLVELHEKLWGREDVFGQVFRAVDLTIDDFTHLQRDLHHLNSSRNQKSYVSRDVLEAKTAFLRSRTATHTLTTTGSPVPKVVLQPPDGLIPMDVMDVGVRIESCKNMDQQEDCEDKDSDKDAMEDKSDENAVGDESDENAMGDQSDENATGDEGDEMGDEGDEMGDESDEDEDSEGEVNDKYIDQDATTLSHTIFPCTIRYMDLTCLNLRHFNRVSQVLLIRDEWDAVVDIFNKRKTGIQGSALLTGQPGTGKYYYGPWISVCKLISP
jgi:hypothetical protein